MLSSPKVSIIILNWNGWRDTLECLESIYKITYPNYQVIVVDNGSTDDSVKRIKSWASENHKSIEVIELPENLGFAKGNNVGVRYAIEHFDPEYVLILNNDTVVEPDFLEPLVSCLQEHPQSAMAAPQVVDYYRKVFWQKPNPWRLNLLTYVLFATQLYRFFGRFIPLDTNKFSKIYTAPGCCLLFKTKSFKEIGLFDENTFLGWEEFLVAERLLREGLETYFVPQSRIYHKIGKGTARIQTLEKIRMFLHSETYFQKKILGFAYFERLIIRLARFLIYLSMLWLQGEWRLTGKLISTLLSSEL